MPLNWLNGLPADKIMEMMALVQQMEEATYEHIEALDRDKIDIREEIRNFIYENVVAAQKMENQKKAEAGDAGPETEELNRVSKKTLWAVPTLMNESGRF